jgi:hypothetical protein
LTAKLSAFKLAFNIKCHLFLKQIYTKQSERERETESERERERERERARERERE